MKKSTLSSIDCQYDASRYSAGYQSTFIGRQGKAFKIGNRICFKKCTDYFTSMKLFDQFDAIVDPASLHRGKPDPEIIIKAQNLLQL